MRTDARTVPAGVLARSGWTNNCPVAAADLRYLTVGFRATASMPGGGPGRPA